MDCSLIKEGDLIFVKTEQLERFFKKYHPKIRHKYILITHNSVFSIPGKFVSYLLHPKVGAWFGHNVDGYVHPKLHPLPVGFENRQYSNGDLTVVTEARKKWAGCAKTMLLYNNFSINTHPTERGKVYALFKDKPFCVTSSRKPYREYLKDLAEAKFVLCPRGNGLDCHRVWESICMGSIPIVKTSASDSLFQDLPVVIIKDWREVTEEFLEQKYSEMSQQSYNFDRMNLDYWLKLIYAERIKILKQSNF